MVFAIGNYMLRFCEMRKIGKFLFSIFRVKLKISNEKYKVKETEA